MLHLVSIALERNPTTRSSWQRAQAAAAQYGRTQAEWYPTLGLKTGFYYGETLYPGPGVSLEVNEWTVLPTLALNYVLLDFGRREADDDRARQSLWAANLEFNRQVQSTIFNVQRTYFRHDEALGLQEAAEQNLVLARTVVEAVEDRMLMGLSTMPELLLARQELARARFQVEATVADVYATKAQLLEVLGYPATTSLEIARLDDVTVPDSLAYRVRDVIDTALQSRPDLAAAVASVRASEAAVRRAEAEFNPQVNLLASVGYNWSGFDVTIPEVPFESGSASDNLPVWTIGVGGSWMIFEGFERENAVREARALRAVAEAELETLRLKAIGQVWTDYFQFIASRKQFEFGEALLSSSQEAYDAMLESYEYGLATITELLAAEKDLAAARSTLVTTRADLLVATAELSYSTGAGAGQAPRPGLSGTASASGP